MEQLTPQQIADKVFELTEQFNQYVFGNPDILDNIPCYGPKCLEV